MARGDQRISSESVEQPGGRQYHLGLGPGEVAPRLLLVGDPARARRFGERFDSVRGEWSNREYVAITGQVGGKEITVLATGIGCDNTEIAVVELSALLDGPAILIRAGSCGALQPHLELGDLVITWGAVRLENTSLNYVPEGYPAVAHPQVIEALRASAEQHGHPHHVGFTATASGFYGAQGRDLPHFPARDPELPARLGRLGVLNLEMETSTLLTLASLRGWRAGAVCTVFAQRARDAFVAPEQKHAFEDRALDCALGALLALEP